MAYQTSHALFLLPSCAMWPTGVRWRSHGVPGALRTRLKITRFAIGGTREKKPSQGTMLAVQHRITWSTSFQPVLSPQWGANGNLDMCGALGIRLGPHPETKLRWSTTDNYVSTPQLRQTQVLAHAYKRDSLGMQPDTTRSFTITMRRKTVLRTTRLRPTYHMTPRKVFQAPYRFFFERKS